MALELVVADMLAKVHQSTANPVQSLEIKRARMRWLIQENSTNISDSVYGRFYPEELQAAVDELFVAAAALVKAT